MDYRVHVYQVTCPLFSVPYPIESILKIDSIVLQSHTNTRLRRFLPGSYKITNIYPLKQQQKCLWISLQKVACVIENFTDLGPEDGPASFLLESSLSDLYFPVFWRTIFASFSVINSFWHQMFNCQPQFSRHFFMGTSQITIDG